MTTSAASASNLRRRARIVRALRDWFEDQGFVEIEAPTLVRSPALEEHLEALPVGDAWLHTSPEFALKRALARGLPRIFSITPCYRAEEWGPLHATEFTMLEWYRAGVGYHGVMEDCEALVRAGAAAVGRELGPFVHLTVEEAFAGDRPQDPIEQQRRWINDIERTLLEPTFVRDYPASEAAFSSLRGPIAERFELYWEGIELGNAFTELLDGDELLQRWGASNTARLHEGRVPYPIDERLVQAVRQHPYCGGMAMGVDRLVMLLLGLSDIREVRLEG